MGYKYYLYIQVDNEKIRSYYEKAIEKFVMNKEENYKDSGFDLFISESFNSNSFVSGSPIKIDHQVCCAVYKEDASERVPTGYYMYPRSSISKTPFRLANSVGIIDSGYRGHLIAKVDNIYNSSYDVSIGDRLFQICTPDLTPFESIEIVDSLDITERGDGGFGSTGK
jgi:dUTP pyrophosphatase